MTLKLHFTTPPTPNTEAHLKHLVEQYLTKKGIPLTPYTVTSKGKKEVNHVYIEIV